MKLGQLNTIMLRAIKISVLFLLPSLGIQAQEKLSFEAALAIALENNHDIQLSRFDEEVAKNNASKLANGYLPSINATGGSNWSAYEGNNQTINNDISYEANNSYNYNAGVTLNYTLFDGFGRKFRLKQSKGTKQLSSIELRQVTENSILQLSRSYYEVARLQQQCASLDSTLVISSLRFLRGKYGFEFGQSTPLDILNAEVDFINDSINLEGSRQQLENTRRSLNRSMGVELTKTYLIDEKVVVDEKLALINVAELALENSTAILTAKQIKENARLGLAQNRSAWFPNLSINGGYLYRGSDDPNGAFLVGSNSYGPNAGVSLSWSLFDGNNRTRIQNAEVQIKQSEVSLANSQEQVKMTALNTQSAFQNALFVMSSREKTLSTTKQNFERSREALKQGVITSVEFRQAQLNLLSAELQLSQARYEAINLELEIRALIGGMKGE
ncbi:MAG: outer membrane protein [Luteibaculaceae bacterium]|jgi:outer membrane protein